MKQEHWTAERYQEHSKAQCRMPGRKRKTATPESGVKKACLELLYLWGCDVLSTPSGMAFRIHTGKDEVERRYPIRFGKKGLGDICAISPYGRWIEVETKSDTGEHQEDQRRRRNEVQKRGGVYVLARSTKALEERKADILARSWSD